MEARSTWNQTAFDNVLKEYMRNTSRDTVTAINTKGFYIARAATRLTMKAGKDKITAALDKVTSVQKVNRSGKTYTSRKRELVMGTEHTEAPLAALLINARLGRSNKTGLYGRAMRTAIRVLVNARRRSNAFLASGWLDAIKTLAPLADRGKKPPMASESEMSRYGVAKGDAIPAVLGPVIKKLAH